MIEREPLEVEMLVTADQRRLGFSARAETADLDRHTCSVPDFDTGRDNCGFTNSAPMQLSGPSNQIPPTPQNKDGRIPAPQLARSYAPVMGRGEI